MKNENRIKVIYVLISLVIMIFFACSSSSSVKKESGASVQILNQAGANSIVNTVYPNYNTNPLPANSSGTWQLIHSLSQRGNVLLSKTICSCSKHSL
jgi:hypothetical protein